MSNGPDEQAAWRVSPLVAGDDELAPGERPFTDYGQFGADRIDTRVLWQDVVWVDRMGTPHFLTAMSQEYRSNVIAFLYRRAPEWYLEALIVTLNDVADAVSTSAPSEALQDLHHRMRALGALNPRTWIDDTPLMQRLLSLHQPRS